MFCSPGLWKPVSLRRPGSAWSASGLLLTTFVTACMGTACSEHSTPPANPQSPSHPTAQAPEQGPAQGQNLSVPQEALARRADAVVLQGKVDVPGYAGGLIQVDVYPADTDMTGQGPLTTLRLKAPGPFKLLLPPEVPRIALRAQLDLKQDGPDWRDPFVLYPGNPLRLDQLPAEVLLQLDLNHTLPPPPGQGEGGERPPWETTEQKSGSPAAVPADAPGGASAPKAAPNPSSPPIPAQ